MRKNHVLGLVLIFSAALSCNSDPPSGPQRDSAARAVRAPATTISSTTDFENAWNGGAFADGTVFRIDGTLTWTTNVQFTASNKSFTIEGDDTTDVLTKAYTGGTSFFFLTDVGTSRAVFKNMKMVRSSGTFMTVSNFRRIDVTNVVFDLGSVSAGLYCDTLNIDHLTFRGSSGLGVNIRSRSGHAFLHNVSNSSFHNSSTTLSGEVCSQAFPSPDEGTATWYNNVFTEHYGSPEGEPFLKVRVNEAANPITLLLKDNVCNKQTLQLFSSTNSTLDIDLEGNDSEIAFCGESILHSTVCSGCSNFVYHLNLISWSFGDEPFSYDDFGPITPDSTCIDAYGMAYVSFSLESTETFAEYQDVWVRYGDDDCTSAGYDEVPAYKNESTGLWNASFPIIDGETEFFPDHSFFWKGVATLCGTVVSGTCQIRTTRVCDSLEGPPAWFSNYGP